MSAHTPGPWTAAINYAWGKLADVRDSKGNSVAFCSTLNEHDARLVAAAPELLSALLDTVGEFEALMKTRKPYTGGMNIALRAHAAIAKATGKVEL